MFFPEESEESPREACLIGEWLEMMFTWEERKRPNEVCHRSPTYSGIQALGHTTSTLLTFLSDIPKVVCPFELIRTPLNNKSF